MNLEQYIEKFRNDEIELENIPKELLANNSEKYFELFKEGYINFEDIPEEIMVKETSEEKRILELQERYRKGKIKTTDISSDDIKKIVKLYNNQINEMKNKIAYNKRMTERYKEEILKMKKEA